MKFTSFWLLVSLFFGTLQGYAEFSGDWEYTVSGGEVTITQYNGAGGWVAVPETLGGLPVKEIGALAMSGKGITGLSIPNSILRLGDNAFSGNPDLSYVSISSNITNLPTGVFANCGFSWFNIPAGVVSIGAGAFYNCANLTEITMHISLIEIQPYAFQDCSSLTNVVFVSSPKVSDGSFQGTPYGNLNPVLDGLGYVSLDGQTNGPLAALFNFQGTDPTNVVIPPSVFGRPVTALKTQTNSFWYTNAVPGGWSSVTNIYRPIRSTSTFLTIPISVTNIEANALAVSNSLTGIDVAEGNPAFWAPDGILYGKDRPRLIRYPSAKTNLSHYLILAGTETIEPSAFAHTKLSSIEIPNSVTSIGSRAFLYSGLTNVTIPHSVTKLDDFAFHSCESLRSVFLGNGITAIKSNTFSYCLNLRNIEIPSSVTSIGLNAFSSSGLTNVTIPHSVTNLDGFAFLRCDSLGSVFLGNGITNIKPYTFSECTNLTKVSLPQNLSRIQAAAFYQCSKLEEIELPESMMIAWTNSSPPLEVGAFAFSPIKKLTAPYGLLLHSGAQGRLTQVFDQALYWASPAALHQTYASSIAKAVAGELATNQVFISNLAQAILAASNNYGLATKTEVGGAVTLGVQQVLSAPSDYNLFTPLQVQSERTAGQSDVLNDPNSYSLYTTNQIQNLGLGGIVLNRNTNNQLVLNYEILQSSDLQNWAPYQQNELVISNAPADKMFLRVQAVEQ